MGSPVGIISSHTWNKLLQSHRLAVSADEKGKEQRKGRWENVRALVQLQVSET